MAISREHVDQPTPPDEQARTQREPLSPAEVLQRLAAFDGPPEAFLPNLLSVQCSLVGATGGALMRPGEGGQVQPIAVFPPLREGQTAPSWLAQMVEVAGPVLQSGQTTVQPIHTGGELYGEGAAQHLVLVPLRTEQGTIGVSGFYLQGAADRLGHVVERLELTSGLLSTYTLRQRLQQREVDLRLLRNSVESLTVVNDRKRFAAAAMAFCNQLSSEWEAERVSIGFLHGRHVKLKATSHTEKFTRNMQLVQAIEAAMEECLDQDLEILYPAGDDVSYVCRAAKTLGTQHGPSAVLSLPLRHEGEVVAVLTVERSPEKPFTLEDVETLRLTADLCTPRLNELQQRDKWFGARAAAGIRRGAAVVIGPKHTWIKLAVIGVAGLLAFGLFAKGMYKVEAPFAMEPTTQHQISAPFDGTLMEVRVEPDDKVKAGDVLALLDTTQLEDELLKVKEEETQYIKQADIARQEANRGDASYAEVQVAQARLRQVRAQIRLLEHRINEATLKAPIDGTVIKGDLRKRIGGPVQKSDELFVVAPLQSMRAELRVDESDIADVHVGDTGELATTGSPGEHITFTVVRIDPVAEVVEQENVFRVLAELSEIREDWKPGMEGVAKVEVEPRTYAWLVTHKLIDWVRMKLWW